MFRPLKSIFLILPLLCGSISFTPSRTSEMDPYLIYPIPQSVEYDVRTLRMTENVNIVTKGEVDQYTIEKAIDVVSLQPVFSRVTNEVDNSKTNLILATYDSHYRTGSDYDYIPTHIDSYYLEINTKDINY